ncbi:hypothetical protein [uncultured Proteiniphilum sp.]|uniref:hypothetical protein n=1 Tax=uncultured Proteiniphilum sp. TaxID=497637 RepID=UPI00263A0B0F|nr:hypothetical protein [uncultured Proteiniphilum sp.]
MNKKKKICYWSILSGLLLVIPLQAQQDSLQNKPGPSLRFSGQLSGWGQYSPDISTQVWLGGRYIPQANFGIPIKDSKLIDFEASANIFGDVDINSFNDFSPEGNIKPYRAWARYSSTRAEVRLGLQKINFGSAQMFRPLMWFDSMDPRDPLQLTDGVWGGLFRYYFPNNTTFWLWSLYGNVNRKGWEILPSSNSFPEIGGRTQIPIPNGEGALSYHFRKADASLYEFKEIAENRFGLDVRLDVTVGLWLETSWTYLNHNIGEFTNQQMMTLGTDYTFGIGNGLNTTFEQFFYSYSEKGIDPDNALNFSGLSLSYPLTMFDNFSAMVYYDWKNRHLYNFLHWQRQLNHLTFYLIGYWNPRQYAIPSQMGASDRFAGKGLQFMVVWHH